jgi:hypothetical protein
MKWQLSPSDSRPGIFARLADWQSAIQQVGNLRYDFVTGPAAI